MRRIFTGIAAAAVMAILTTLAMAGNQEMADQIAQKLRASGRMNGYKIGIKCQDGTVWLRGHVVSEQQMNTALQLAFQTTGVKRVVNELSLVRPSEATADDAQPSSRTAPKASQNPLRSLSFGATTHASRPSQKTSFVKRLEAVITRSSDQSPSVEEQPQAERVSNTFHPAPITRVSAEEAQDEEQTPRAMRAPAQARPMAANYVSYNQQGPMPCNNGGRPLPMYTAAANASGAAPARYDQPCLPNYAWPSYAAYPNYAAVTYPKQYSPTAWPYIGPFYPYPQVPLGWRKVTLEWDDGWWFLDFKDQPSSCWHR